MPPKRGIFANALHYVTGQGAIAVFGLVSSVVLARYLPKAEFGLYSYLVALAILFLPFLDLGGHTLYAVLAARERPRAGYFWARAIAVKFYALPLTALLLGAYFFATTHVLGAVFVVVLIYTIMQSLLLSTDIAFRSLEQGRSWAIRRVIYEAASFLLLASAVVVFHIRSVPVLLALATIAILGAGSWAVYTVVRSTKLTGTEFLAACRKPFDRMEISALWPFAVNTVLWVIYYRETNVLLENLGKHADADLADYRVAYVIMTAALYIPKAVIWASAPRIALHDEQKEHEKFNRLVRQSAGVNLFLAVFLTLGGFVYGEHLIGLIFGHKYAHLGLTWRLFDLVLGLLFIQQFTTDLLNAVRRERFVVYALVVGITILTALSVVLIPRYGVAGAAAAQLAACAVMVPMNLYSLMRRVGAENLHGLALGRLALVCVIATAVGMLLLPVNYYLSLVAFLVVFLPGCYLLGAMPEQFQQRTARLLGVAPKQHLG